LTVAQNRRKAQHQQGSSLKPFYIILAVVAIAGAAGIGWALYGGGGAGGDLAAIEPVPLSDIAPQDLVRQARGVIEGPGNAPVQILVFSDYMCPYCAQFALNIETLIKQNYVANGQVQYIYHDFPLGGSHIHSFVAARAARCAEDQGRFWEYHNILLAQQTNWMYDRSTPYAKFNEYARQAGLDVDSFRGCVNSDRHAELVTANYMLGQQLRVGGTPTVFINGQRMDRPLDWGAMRARIEENL
jgi:protein-disulfide isomerase